MPGDRNRIPDYHDKKTINWESSLENSTSFVMQFVTIAVALYFRLCKRV